MRMLTGLALLGILVAALGLLPVAPAQAATEIDWLGGTSAAWATGANWNGGAAPTSDLTTNIAGFIAASWTNQPNAGTTSINGINVGDGTNATPALTISTTALSIGNGGITINPNAGTVTLNNAVKLGASQSWTNNSSSLFTVGATVTNMVTTSNYTLTINGSGSGGTKFNGIISDNGAGKTLVLVNTTGGTTTFAAQNTFTGGFTLRAGSVQGTGNNTQVFGNGTITLGDTAANAGNVSLNFTGTSTIAKGITLNSGTTGTITISGTTNTNAFSGAIALNNALVVDNTTSGKTTTFSGTITGNKTITKSAGAGNVAITGTNTTSFTGNVLINGGILNFTTNGLGQNATGGTITFGGGTLQYAAAANTQDISGRLAASPGAIKIDANNNAVVFANALTSTNTNTLTLTSTTAGGSLTLTGAQTYTGLTTVTTGTLKLASGATIKSGNALTTAAGGSFDINGNSQTLGLVTNGGTTNGVTNSGAAATLTIGNGSTGAGAWTGEMNVIWNQAATSSSLTGSWSNTGDITLKANGAGTITLGTGTVNNAGAIINSGTGTANVTIGAGIGANVTSVTQNSAGSKLILSGTNSYAGGTNVNAGLVQFNAAGALPASGNVAVAANAAAATGTGITANTLLAKITTASAGALAINAANSEDIDFGTGGYNSLYLGSYGNNTYSGALTPGSGGYLLGGGGGTLTVAIDLAVATPLTVNGGVTLTPDTSNSFTSALIKSGTVTLGNAGAMDTTIPLTMQGGTLNLNGQAASWNWATFSGTGGTITDGGTGVDTTAVTLNAPSDAVLSAITQTTRTVSLTKTGAGTLTLTGTSTFSGDTTITDGTLKAGKDNMLASGVGKGNVVLDGGASAAGTLDLNGFDLAVGGLSGTTGAVLGQVVNNATGTAKTLTVGSNNATTEFAGAIKDNNSGTGTVALAKTGTGALALSGTNTYTGATTISGGKLYANGSLTGSPTVAVAAGTTLGGKGTVAGVVTVSDTGNVEAGQGGTGSLAIGGGLTFSNTATAVFGDPSQYGTNPGINVTGNLTASGGANSVVLNVPDFPIGTWHLFGYTGVLNDFSAFKMTLPARATGTLQNPAGYVDLNITAFDYIRWVGGGASPTVWDTSATGNWKLNSDNSSVTYLEGDKVVFDDSATGKAVDVATADISPYSITFENTAGAANEYTLTSTASKVITGATGLAVTGGGKVTIDSAMLNSFTGQVNVKSGTLSVGAINNDSAAGPLGSSALPVILGGSTGTLQYTGGTASSTKKFTLAAGGTGAFQIDTAGTVLTLSGVINGEGSLVKTGDGDLVLAGSNSYGGTTTISAGSLQINAPSAGIPGTSDISIDAACTLQWNRAAATDNLTLINAITGTGTLKINFATGTTALNTKLVGLNGFAGTIQLSNTGGTSDKFSVATVNAPSVAVIIDPGTQVYVGGNATFKSIQVSGTGNGENRGAIRLQTGTLTVLNGITLMGDTAFGPEGGTLAGNISSGVAPGLTLTLGTVSSTGNATINDIIGGGLGTIALTKTAAGTATLLGANTYTGKTSIQAGTLKVSSLNYVTSGTWGTPTSSSLGVPGNPADGTIDFGATTTTGTLLYTGAGETTDRVVNLAGTTGGGTIDQSGTGLLKFTSDLTATGVGAKTLTLQGAGTGEFTGAIADNTTIGSTLLATAFASGAGTVTLTSVDGVSVGAAISGTGIADATTVTAINTATKVVTLSAVTTGAGVVNQTMTVDGVRNSTSVAKAGTGTWTPTNDNNTYTGATTITGGTLIASTIVEGGPSSLGGGTAVTLSGAAASNATLKYTGGSVTTTRTFTVTNTAGNTGTLEITQPGTKLTINAKVASGGNYPIFYKDGPGTLELGGDDPAGNTMDNTSLNLQVRQGTVILNKTGLNTNRACARLTSVLDGATVQLGDSSNGDQIYAIVQGMDGTFDMNGQNEAVTVFSSTSGVTTGLLTNTKAATSSTLSINTASTFDGTVADGASGAGVLALTNNGNVVVNMTNTGNTFTGPITSYGGTSNMITFNSIGDSTTNGIVLGSTTTAGGFKWTGPAVTLNRPVSLAGTTGGGTINSSGTGALNLANTDAIATGDGAKALTLTGTNTDGNTLAGIIADSTGGATSLTKSGGAAGSTTKWILSGANTFTGNVTISAGQLWITNSSALGAGTKTVTMTNGSAGNCQLYLDGSGGNIVLPSTISFSTSNSSTNGTIFNVAGDNTINGNFSMVGGGGNTHIVSNGGTLTLTGSFTSNASPPRILVLDGTTSGNIFSGILQDGSTAAILEKRGAGTWTLSGTAANTYTGMTTVNGGELDLNKTGVNAVGGDLTILDGTVKFLVSEQIINSSILSQSAGLFDLNGMTETIAAYTKTGGAFRTGMGGHLIGTGATLTYGGGTSAAPDIIDADAMLEDGHVVLSSGEYLTALGANDAGYGASPGTAGGIVKVAAGGTGLEMTGAVLTLNSDSTSAASLQLFGDVTTLASSTTSVIANGVGNSPAVSGRVDLEGGVRTFTVAQGSVPSSGADLSVSAVIANGGLTKTGAGRMLLTGVDLYAGKTTITQGVLEIAGSGSIALSPMIELKSGATLDVRNAVPLLWTLASGQTLKGSGTVMGDMAVGNGSTLSPGDSPGTLTQDPGNQTWAGGGTYLWEVNTVDNSVVEQPLTLQGKDPGFDFVSIAGALHITATSGQKFVIDITGLDPATHQEGGVAGWNGNGEYSWVIATAAGGITGFDSDAFDLLTGKFTSNNSLAGKFTVRQDGNNVVLYAPEPATLALLGLGGLGLLLGRKRK